MNEERDLYGQATDMLYAAWKGIDPEFKSRYRAKIWQIFEDRIRVAAGQNGNLAGFISQLARSLQAFIGTNAAHRDMARKAIDAGNDRDVLRLLREETPYVVLLIRMEMQKERELYDAD
jgi:hypothetical protein